MKFLDGRSDDRIGGWKLGYGWKATGTWSEVERRRARMDWRSVRASRWGHVLQLVSNEINFDEALGNCTPKNQGAVCIILTLKLVMLEDEQVNEANLRHRLTE